MFVFCPSLAAGDRHLSCRHGDGKLRGRRDGLSGILSRDYAMGRWSCRSSAGSAVLGRPIRIKQLFCAVGSEFPDLGQMECCHRVACQTCVAMLLVNEAVCFPRIRRREHFSLVTHHRTIQSNWNATWLVLQLLLLLLHHSIGNLLGSSGFAWSVQGGK